MEKAGRDLAGSIRGHKERSPPANGTRPYFYGLRSADEMGNGAFRCPAYRRNGSASGKDFRDGDGRRQDSGRDSAAIFERPNGARGPSGDGERLPGAT